MLKVFFKTTTATSFPSQSRALPGVDFVPRDSSLVMRENSTKAAISISIIPDDVPEDIESFYVVITGVKLIGESEYNTQPGKIFKHIVCCCHIVVKEFGFTRLYKPRGRAIAMLLTSYFCDHLYKNDVTLLA